MRKTSKSTTTLPPRSLARNPQLQTWGSDRILKSLKPQLRMGFAIAIQSVLRLREGGLLFGGPPCATFVWMSRSTTKRSSENPQGAEDCKVVQVGNQTALRALMLAVLSLVRGAHWAFEQPGSSVMCKMEQFLYVFRTAFQLGFGKSQLTRLFLGAFES